MQGTQDETSVIAALLYSSVAIAELVSIGRRFQGDIDFPLCSKPRPARHSIEPGSTHLSLHGTRNPTFAALSYPAVDLPFSDSSTPFLRFVRSYDLLKNVRPLRVNPFHPPIHPGPPVIHEQAPT